MYDVGQTVFVILKKKQRIIPVQVIEQIVRRSRKGESTQYIVKVPSYDDPMDITSLGDDIYVSLDDVKIALKRNAEVAIEKMIDGARSLAGMHFKMPNEPIRQKENVDIENQEEGHVAIDLGDGQNAKINVADLEKLSL